ncbi:MAG: biotin/lipoyl-binding protein [Tannerellaceae bacterium]
MEPVISSQDGRIVEICGKQGSLIKKGDIIAYLG